MHTSKFVRTVLSVLLGLVILIPATAFAQTVEFWTQEIEPERMSVIRDIVKDFEAANPDITVKIVPVDEDDMPTKLAAARAAGNLPDVAELGLSPVTGYAAAGMLDTKMATETVKELGVDTFSPAALNLLRNGSDYAAVPTDAFVILTYYRKDVFADKGLDKPDSLSNLLKSAEALHNPPGTYGISLASDPKTYFTQQAIELYGLANGARIFDANGNVIVNNDRMLEMIQMYKDLLAYSPPGFVDSQATRQYYITNRTNMATYATYMLGNVAGASKELASKTGAVAVMEGFHGDKSTYGELYSMAIMDGATPAAKTFVKFILGDGYIRWLFLAPHGKAPVRNTGIEEWQQHPTLQAFGPDMVDKILDGLRVMERWGFVDGKTYPSIDNIYGNFVFPDAIVRMRAENWSAQKTLDWITKKVNEIVNQ